MNIWNRACDTFVPHARNNYAPYAIGRKPLSVYAGLMVTLKLVTAFSVTLLPVSQAMASDVTAANILQLTNYSRSVFGISDLQFNNQLTLAAQAKVEDMFAHQYFGHDSPQGLTPWNFIKAQGYNYIIAGENLAINFSTSEGVEKAWMSSPGHKANILNKDFQDLGVGIASGTYQGKQTTIVVQLFGSSIDQPYTAKTIFDNPKPVAAALPGVDGNNSPLSTVPLIPVPNKISLQTPILDNPQFSLTNKQDYTISGFAPGANYAYVLVNHQPQAKFEVIQGHFSGSLNLEEGQNLINAVSFDNSGAASPISNNVIIQLDTVAPVVDSAQVQPVSQNGQTYYQVNIQSSSDAAKIIASVGGQNIMLQPGVTANSWIGQFALDPNSGLNGQVMVSAYDLAGNSQATEIASLAPSLQQNYDSIQTAQEAAKSLAKNFVYDQFNIVYLYFVLFLMVMLALAIGIKRNVQHLGLIAHVSAMAMVAVIFWVT